MSAQKKAAFQILAFLDASLKDGSIREDDKEGIEVASQCISEAFGVDLEADKAAYSIEPESLVSLLDKHVAAPKAAATPAPAPKVASAEDKAVAEKLKSTGNQLMARKDFDGAIKAYGDAIAVDGSNAVYWSNRAAAHSQNQSHFEAIADARKALEIDPKFSKAYSRLGHALFSSGQYAEAVEAYEKGLELDPNNATMKSSLATARSRIPEDEDDDDQPPSLVPSASSAAGARGAGGMPDLSSMMNMFGGGGGGGGMPDMAAMMQNPAIMQMAQSMMANGGMEQLMQSPMMQQMMGGGGGMPDMASLLADPTMRRMAESLRGAGAGSGSGANNDSMYS